MGKKTRLSGNEAIAYAMKQIIPIPWEQETAVGFSYIQKLIRRHMTTIFRLYQ
jgi:hypothetical protein